MKKCIICIISALIFCTTYVYTYVYAEEEDILSDPIVKEEEDIKEDSEDEPISDGVGIFELIDENTYNELFAEPTLEPIPEPTPEPEPEIDPETLSGNEILREILRTNREISKDVKGVYQYLSNNSVSDSVLSDNSVSNNIINKPLSEYDLKESLLLFIALLGISAALVYIIHKSIFKWG